MTREKDLRIKGKLVKLDDAIKNLPEKVKTRLGKSKESDILLFKNSFVIPFPPKYRASRPTLCYRVSPANDGLVFAEPERAEYIAGIHDALQNAKTWGEFKAKLDPEEYEQILFSFDENDEPRPKNSDPFDASSVPGYCDGDYPDWLQQDMDYWLPEDILEKYATNEVTMLNGNYYHIDEGHEEAICRDLKALGFEVIRRDDLYFY